MTRYKFLFFILFSLIPFYGWGETAREVYQNGKYRFLSYGKIPTWTGMAAQWRKAEPEIYLYDSAAYPGHGDFVCKGLKTGMSFQQFKAAVQSFGSRLYVPFFLYDLRDAPLKIEGKTFDWAVRIEDYGFTDTRDEMAETAVRFMRVLGQTLDGTPPENCRGILVLSDNPKIQPNSAVAPVLTRQGYTTLTLNQLLNLTGAKQVEILNPGVAVGKLRRVSPQDSRLFRYTPHDILIFDEIPARVPPAAGIITLRPQTPLSHVNLLCRNRGTPNLYTLNLHALPGLNNLIDKYVRLDADPQRILIQEISEEEARKHWESVPPRLSAIPQPDRRENGIIDLQTASTNLLTPSVIGAKAANYALIHRHFPRYVRPGYALPFSFYFQHLSTSGADKLIDALLAQKEQMTPEEIEITLSNIRAAIRSTSVNPSVIRRLHRFLRSRYAGKKIRLRSSTNCEDLPDFNGAGLYLSRGFRMDSTPEKLSRRILEVYASLWTFSAFAEREYFGIDHRNAGMALLINQAFEGETANGVVLTVPAGEKTGVIVNSQPSNHSVANPASGDIPEGLWFSDGKFFSYRLESASSYTNVFSQNPEYEPLLKDLLNLSLEIQELLTRSLDQSRKYGTDVEFKIMSEDGFPRLYLKQARLLGQIQF